jgi:hypothetical protein
MSLAEILGGGRRYLFNYLCWNVLHIKILFPYHTQTVLIEIRINGWDKNFIRLSR